MKKNILLIHGWDYTLYTSMTKSKDAWYYAKDFIDMLEEKYNVYKINLPGFCYCNEPKDKYWNINNFSEYIHNFIKSNNLKIDIIIGYSFGGAVAIDYKNKYKTNEKLFLIAPAIIRNNNNSKNFVNTPKILKPIRNKIRDLYVIYFIKNNEMKYGTKFLRNTYQSIVREDKRKDLYNIDPKDVIIVYGNKDTAVNPNVMLNTIKKEYLDNIKIIENANHDNIITKHAKELKQYIKSL